MNVLIDSPQRIENVGDALIGIKQSKYKDDSLALHTDLYQINMAETYWEDGLQDRRAVFDIYFRKAPFNNGYAVFAGLDRVIDYLNNFKFSQSDLDYLQNELGYERDFIEYLRTLKFDGSIRSVVEGEIVYPNEPILRVEAKLGQAQIIETALLNIVNYHTLVATKAARIRCTVGSDQLIEGMSGEPSLMEFGTRRAQEFDAAIYGTRAAYIGGFNGTSNVRAGKLFGIPVSGTHAHSMVQVYGDEYKAFHKFAKRHRNCIFLVDTYDTLKSGVPNAIKVAKELGDAINFVGIRLDSGDLAYLSKEARKMLDEAGFKNAKIFASNDLDEYAIAKLKEEGAKIDGWGVGTKLITAFDQPALGAVYKLAAIEDENGNMVDTIKLSESSEKTSTPGMKKVYRIVDLINKKAEKDFVVMDDEVPQNVSSIHVSNASTGIFDARDIHKDIFINGQLIYKQPDIEQMRSYCISNLKMLKNSFRDINQSEQYTVELSQKCSENKEKNIVAAKSRINEFITGAILWE